VTRGGGLYVRRQVVEVKTYRTGARVQLACSDHTTPLLDAGQSIIVKRNLDDEPVANSESAGITPRCDPV
jgi:hypothetical protein